MSVSRTTPIRRSSLVPAARGTGYASERRTRPGGSRPVTAGRTLRLRSGRSTRSSSGVRPVADRLPAAVLLVQRTRDDGEGFADGSVPEAVSDSGSPRPALTSDRAHWNLFSQDRSLRSRTNGRAVTEILEKHEEFYVERDAERALTMVLTGRWSPAAGRRLRNGDIESLRLTYTSGFHEESLEFLEDWPIRTLRVLDPGLRDVTAIKRLAGSIETLLIKAGPSVAFDPSVLPRLRSLDGDWHGVCVVIRRAGSTG